MSTIKFFFSLFLCCLFSFSVLLANGLAAKPTEIKQPLPQLKQKGPLFLKINKKRIQKLVSIYESSVRVKCSTEHEGTIYYAVGRGKNMFAAAADCAENLKKQLPDK